MSDIIELIEVTNISIYVYIYLIDPKKQIGKPGGVIRGRSNI